MSALGLEALYLKQKKTKSFTTASPTFKMMERSTLIAQPNRPLLLDSHVPSPVRTAKRSSK